MNRFAIYFAAFLLMLLVSCSENESGESTSNKTVIDNQLRALEKAKNVEQQILESAAKQKERIDAQN